MKCGECQTVLPQPEDVTSRYVTCTQCGTQTDVTLERTMPGGSGTSHTLGPSEMAIDLTGQTLGRGTYLVEAKIGQGGMGQVYSGRHLRLDQEVAIKIISPQLAAEEEFVARFQREGQTLGRIRHEGVVRVLDANREGDLHYLVMEYVRGPEGRPTSLRDLIRNTPLEPKRALEIVAQACDALQSIHDMGIIHRDLKPGNFLINEHGRALVADFGIATVRGVPGEHTYTATGAILGDPTYMSPEQRVNPKGVDHRTDVYSLGLLFYEILVGEVPQGHFDPPSEARKGLPPALDEIVLKALKQAPEARYQTMAEFGAAVREAQQRIDRPVRKISAGKWLMTAAAVVVFSLAGVLLIADDETQRGWIDAFRSGGEEPEEEVAAEAEVAEVAGKPEPTEDILRPVGSPSREVEATEAPAVEEVPVESIVTTPEAFVAAVESGDTAAIGAMLEQRPALLDVEWPERRPALHTAVVNGREEALEELLFYGANSEVKEPALGRTALHVASNQGDAYMAKILLQAFAEVDAIDFARDTALHLAVQGRHVGTVQVLLEYGADPGRENESGETPVRLADSAGMTDIAEEMRRIVVAESPGADTAVVNTPGSPVVTIEEPAEEVRPAAPSAAEPTPAVTTPAAASPYPLHDAAAQASLAEFQELVQSGRYDVNQQRNSDGNTPMHIAAGLGRKSWVEFLLGHGAAKSRNIKNHARDLPIDVASRNGHEQTKQAILSWKSSGVAGW